MTAEAPSAYWEDRAKRFARDGAGLRAVCSYGMPWFYNRAIHWTQWLALRRWLRVAPGTSVLDIGCGIGRWSRFLARHGGSVTGVDLSPTMIEEARLRTASAGLQCRYLVSDLATLDVREQFRLIFGVTVLQHILDERDLEDVVDNLVRHLEPGGRVVLLEAAPSLPTDRCDTSVFRARPAREYEALFHRAGLRSVQVTGVDPAPFKTWYLPYHRSLPRWFASAALSAVTIASLPIDLLFGRRCISASWHKVFVLEHR